jgi:hypothetical protein
VCWQGVWNVEPEQARCMAHALAALVATIETATDHGSQDGRACDQFGVDEGALSGDGGVVIDAY